MTSLAGAAGLGQAMVRVVDPDVGVVVVQDLRLERAWQVEPVEPLWGATFACDGQSGAVLCSSLLAGEGLV